MNTESTFFSLFFVVMALYANARVPQQKASPLVQEVIAQKKHSALKKVGLKESSRVFALEAISVGSLIGAVRGEWHNWYLLHRHG